MNTAERLIVAIAIADIAWRFVASWLRAGDALRRAPWPQPRLTPEPRRLTLVRGDRPYDWARDDADRAFPRARG